MMPRLVPPSPFTPAVIFCNMVIQSAEVRLSGNACRRNLTYGKMRHL
jgi:hypothetical protein